MPRVSARMSRAAPPEKVTSPKHLDGSVGGREISRHQRRPPMRVVAESAPVMNPDVAAVLTRIVRALRSRREHRAA